jgi:biotin carboxyl carrier protein
MDTLAIKINGKEYSAVPDKTDKNAVVINGTVYRVEQLKTYSGNVFSFSVNQRLLQISIDMRQEGSSYIIADGFVHELEIKDENRKLLEKFIQQNASSAEATAAKIKAPMPGLVIKILVEEGSHVKKGEKILIIEAMKMENTIASPIDGVIKYIHVHETDAVEKNTLLAEISKD